MDGDRGNDAEEEEEERRKEEEEGVWTAEDGSSFKQRHQNPLNRARERRRARLEAEHMRPPEDVDAGGASARVGDADDPRLRERARGIIRKDIEEGFRLAKQEFEQDGNYVKFKKIELRYYDIVAELNMMDMKAGKFWNCLNSQNSATICWQICLRELALLAPLP